MPSPSRRAPPRSRSQANPRPRIGLALAGGGPLGAIYEVGALCALDEALQGLALHQLDHYVGVSAGGFMAAGLANGLTPRQLFDSFIEHRNGEDLFDPAWLMTPAYGEWARRGLMLPGLLAASAWSVAAGHSSWTQALERLGAALPAGIFSGHAVHQRLGRLFAKAGRTNDFRQLRTRLTLVATNLDTGEAAPFGQPGWDHVPISLAVQASAALPGLFPPVEIDGAYYVDGALKKTMHASVALDEGVDLMLCINPLVPFLAQAADRAQHPSAIPRILDGGLPAVLSQTFRTMIHSRMALGMQQYEHAYPHADIVLIEPDRQDPELFDANTFRYGQRRQLAEHAYQQTRRQLRERAVALLPQLHRHGLGLDMGVLADPARSLLAPSAAAAPRTALQTALDTLEHSLQRLERVGKPGSPAQAGLG